MNLARLATTALSTSLVACGGSAIVPNTHFVYPNSNVEPLLPTQGKAIKVCGFLFVAWSGPDIDLTKKALQRALARMPGAHLLINAQTDHTVIPVFPVLLLCRVRITGTAAKMTVGEQALGPPAEPSVTRGSADP